MSGKEEGVNWQGNVREMKSSHKKSILIRMSIIIYLLEYCQKQKTRKRKKWFSTEIRCSMLIKNVFE